MSLLMSDVHVGSGVPGNLRRPPETSGERRRPRHPSGLRGLGSGRSDHHDPGAGSDAVEARPRKPELAPDAVMRRPPAMGARRPRNRPLVGARERVETATTTAAQTTAFSVSFISRTPSLHQACTTSARPLTKDVSQRKGGRSDSTTNCSPRDLASLGRRPARLGHVARSTRDRDAQRPPAASGAPPATTARTDGPNLSSLAGPMPLIRASSAIEPGLSCAIAASVASTSTV
jgi:hypothetical protein